ncbi:ribulose-phosphate 3-epimerase [Flavobacteriales bacterium]|nr:ribulose-phosphate 3-epimerase [Flavobacteriales bacterium]
MKIISPSMLSCDFGKLVDEIEMVNQSEAGWFHLDIMDGVFVPNISFGTPILEVFMKYATKHLDAHLMIINPENYIEKFASLGAKTITVHYEACNNLINTINQIKKLGVKAGVAINPDTAVSSLESIISEIDLVCLMSVFPGFSGQKFIPETFIRLEKLKQIITKNHSKAMIQIDGGVDLDNAKKLVSLGADILVAGSFVFKSEDAFNTIKKLNSVIN